MSHNYDNELDEENQQIEGYDDNFNEIYKNIYDNYHIYNNYENIYDNYENIYNNDIEQYISYIINMNQLVDEIQTEQYGLISISTFFDESSGYGKTVVFGPRINQKVVIHRQNKNNAINYHINLFNMFQRGDFTLLRDFLLLNK